MTLGVNAQNKYAQLVVDNDLFFLTDYYYTSGIFWHYGYRVLGEEASEEKVFHQWELGQEIYTPSDLFSEEVATYDYPYGGWSYLRYGRLRALSDHQQFNWSVQTGVTGDWSLARWMQNTYHTGVLGLRENAWLDQVPNAVHVNIKTQYFFQQPLHSFVHFHGQAHAQLGTQRTDAGLRLGLSFGSAPAVGVGQNVAFNHQKGDGFYLGARTHYVLHDYMLGGSLFNNDARFTVPLLPWRLELESGMSVRAPRWMLSFFYRYRSPDHRLQPTSGQHLMQLRVARIFD